MLFSVDELLDQIFGDPKVKHKLDLFTPREKNRLQLFEKGGKLRIRCMVRDRDFAPTPEEVVRQLALIHLHYTLGYDLDRLAVEVKVQMGSGISAKAADIVVYRDALKLIPYIVVEVKKPGRKDGREQLHSYMNANGAPFGMWTNGGSGKLNVAYELRTDPNLFAELPRLPGQGESLDDVLEPIRKKDLQPAEDLIGLVMQMQEEVLANAGVNVFEEVFKLFFVKLWDEENASDDPRDDSSICRFRRTADEPEKQYPRFKRLLEEATQVYSDIFPIGTDFDLSPEALLVAVSVLERVRLSDTDLELIDLTFEYLMSPESKGDKGQYFTPRQVVRMAVRMLNPKMNETMLDPACGPCGFPIHTLLHVRDHELRPRYTNWETRVQNYGKTNLFAVDFDGRVVRVAKFMMRLAGDGRANVFRMNSLDKREWVREQEYMRQVGHRQFDVIMTNPPFAGTIRHPQILSSYDLGFNETLVRRKTKDEVTVFRQRKQLENQTRDVLFLDYCLNKLKPGGRMAIVLPQGNFNNISAEPIRRYMMSRARILAVVGLEVNTFKPHTGTKTSVLFIQRWAGQEAADWAAWYDALYAHEAAVAEYQALLAWREELLGQGMLEIMLPDQIRQPPTSPGDPPTPPSDYPIFFATSRRSGRDNSGRYDYLKNTTGQIVIAPKRVLAHDEAGQPIEIDQDRPVLNTDLDQIAKAFVAWGQEQRLDFFAPSPADDPMFASIVVGADFDVSEVTFFDLESARRIDSEYYKPHLLKAEAILERINWPVVTLGDLIKDGYRVVYENTEILSEEFDPDRHVKFLQATDISASFPVVDPSSIGWVSKNDWYRYPQGHIRRGEILVEVKGQAEKVFLVPEDFPENILVTGTLYKMLVNEAKVDRHYVFIYLLSRFGCDFRDRGKTNTLISYVNKADLYNIPVPLLPEQIQKEVAETYCKAYASYKQAVSLYIEAEQLLLDELGLHNLELTDTSYSEAKLTEVWMARRLDADYFQPKYYQVLNAIYQCAYPHKPLGELVEPIRNGFDYREYTEKGTPYIRVGDIRNGRINVDGAVKVLITQADVKKNVRLQVGDVLFTRKGTFGQAAVVRKGQEQAIISSEIMLLRLLQAFNMPILPNYLALFLNSDLGYQQVERRVHGMAYYSISQPDLAQVEIVIPPLAIQERIITKFRDSLIAEQEAMNLIEQAKRTVETLIESEATYG